MTHPTRSRRRGRGAVLAFAITVAFASSYALPLAQGGKKKALTVEDYTKWRSISGQELSGDGQWVAYGLSFSNTAPTESKPVLGRPLRSRARSRPRASAVIDFTGFMRL